MNPKLSVVIPSYNHEDYIAETLKSLEKQTFQDFEVIMIDDGSRDRTVEVAANASSRAQIYIQGNQGVVAARNRGIRLAKGQYICFVDSDDVVLADNLRQGLRTMFFNPHLPRPLASEHIHHSGYVPK